MWQAFIDLLNTDAAVATVASIAAWLIASLFKKKPSWQKYYTKYKPIFVDAIRYAEETIPDDTDNKSLKRLDVALNYAIRVIEESRGSKVAKAETDPIVEAINETHREKRS